LKRISTVGAQRGYGLDVPMVGQPRRSLFEFRAFLWTDRFSQYPVYNRPVPYENRKVNEASKFADEFTMERRPTQKKPLQFFKLVMNPHDGLLEGHLRLEEPSLGFPRGEAKLQGLGPDAQGKGEDPVSVSEKCGVEDPVSDFKRNDRVDHSLEAPVRDEGEVLRCGFKRGKAVTELAGGPEIEPDVAIGAGEDPVRLLQRDRGSALRALEFYFPG